MWKTKHHDFEEPEEWEQPVADEQVPGHMLWEGFGVLDSSFRHMEIALNGKWEFITCTYKLQKQFLNFWIKVVISNF